MREPHRIAVVGTSCSGKTTFARSLGKTLGVPHVELDALFWGPEWTAATDEAFEARVRSAIAADAWVCDGNYQSVRDQVWTRANTLVWLNLDFPLVFWRAVSRTFRRALTREELYGGNRESLRSAFVDPEWIPWWVIRTHGLRRREYPALFQREEFAHLEVIELCTPAEARELLASLE